MSSAALSSFDIPAPTTSLALQQVRGLARTLWKRRWSAFTFLLIVMTVVSVYTFSREPVYKASTLLRINKDDLKVLSFKEFVEADESTDELIKTEVEVLRSRDLADKVASVLNLGAEAAFQSELKPGLAGSIVGRVRGALGSGWDAEISEQMRREIVVSRLLDMLEVEPVRGSRLVKMNVLAHSPRLAGEIANTWSEIYIKQSVESKMHASRLAGQMLAKQIDEQQRIVEQGEKKLQAYAREHGIFSFEDGKTGMNQRLTEVNSLLTAARAELIGKEVTCTSMQSDPTGTEVAVKDPVVQRLREEAARLEGDYCDMLKVFKPEYPDCLRLRARIGQLNASITQQTAKWLQSAATDFAAAGRRVEALRSQLDELQNEAIRLQDLEVDYNTLSRELETSSEHYRALLARRKEALSSMQIRASRVSVVDKAQVPMYAHSPRVALNLALALVLGTILACGTCVLLEFLDTSVRTADDVERELGEPLLGVVPEIDEDDTVGSENRDLISHLDGKSTVSEAYRVIRTSLAFSAMQGEMKNIVVSSAVPGEGKTITAINIATVLGQAGEKVLLVDADMRRPRLHRSLHLPNNRGLSTCLVGQCELRDVIGHTLLPNVDAIVSGPTPPNPSELLDSERMTQLLKECRLAYDHVIIDTPPVMAVTDGRLAAAKADGLIHVIHAGKTEKACARMAKKQFDSVGARVLGAVLNNVEHEEGGSYYYDYYRPYAN